MAKGTQYNHLWLKEKGFTINPDGSYSPPVIKSEYIKSLKGELVTKEKVVETPDFIVTPVTEWFISGYSVPSKKNSRQNFVKNGKQMSIPSKSHAHYVKMTAMQYAVFGKEFKRSVDLLGLISPLRVEFTFIRATRHRSDFTNMCQTVEDLMVSNNWLPDDDSLHLIPSFTHVQYNSSNPGVKIRLIKN